MANNSLPRAFSDYTPVPGVAPPMPALVWAPEHEAERRRVAGDLRRLDTWRENALNALRGALFAAGLTTDAQDLEAIILSAHDLREALKPFDTGEVPF